MKKISFAFLLSLSLLTACESSKQITIVSSWLNKEKIKAKPIKKIYIMGLFNNPTVSTVLEYELATEANARRYITFRNREEFPYIFDNPEDGKVHLLDKVKSLECDAIFVTSLKDVQSETHYVSTSSIGVSTGGYYPMNGSANNFNTYYAGYYHETSLSGYYQTNKLYFIESNLYDANTSELLWSVQSKSYNPGDIEKVSKAYVNELFKLLEKEKDFKGRRIKEK
ncbi:MAG: hypothetical protein ABI723_22010 [Bacteroidia bacterium]